MNSAQAWVSAGKSVGITSCGIAVMAKASAPGRTKTRLVPPLTHEEAADFNTVFLRDISANILEAGEGRATPPPHADGPPRPPAPACFWGAPPGGGRPPQTLGARFWDG